MRRLLALSRWQPIGPITRWVFKKMHHFLPVDRLSENEDWVAIHHPQPEYPLHILILPKQSFELLSESPEDQPTLYASLFEIVKGLICEFNLDNRGYRLITNGGPNQSIPLWHWHLISESGE